MTAQGFKNNGAQMRFNDGNSFPVLELGAAKKKVCVWLQK